MDSVAGKIILVTGATSGIGREAALALAAQGARVIVGARSAASAAPLLEELRAHGHMAETFEADLSSFTSIRAAAAAFLASHDRLDVLVNNAGVMQQKRAFGADGYELTWTVNVLAPFLITSLLRPALDATPGARVITVGSVAYKFASRLNLDDPEVGKKFSRLYSYPDSKLAVVLFTRELARRAPHLIASAVHPGGIATNIWRDLPGIARSFMQTILPSAADGAKPIVRLAIDPAATTSGRYFDKLREEKFTYAASRDDDARKLWNLIAAQTGATGEADVPATATA